MATLHPFPFLLQDDLRSRYGFIDELFDVVLQVGAERRVAEHVEDFIKQRNEPSMAVLSRIYHQLDLIEDLQQFLNPLQDAHIRGVDGMIFQQQIIADQRCDDGLRAERCDDDPQSLDPFLTVGGQDGGIDLGAPDPVCDKGAHRCRYECSTCSDESNVERAQIDLPCFCSRAIEKTAGGWSPERPMLSFHRLRSLVQL